MKLDYSWNSPKDFRCWGPYLSFWNSTSSQMRISWQSKFFSKERWIKYGETPAFEHTIKEKVYPPTTMHSILLDNLKPNTTYYFQISRPEDLHGAVTWGCQECHNIQEDDLKQPIYKFKTGIPQINSSDDLKSDVVVDKKEDSKSTNEPEPFEFAVVGDMHIDDFNRSETFQSIKRNAPNARFIATVGDCVSHGGEEERWNQFFYHFTPFATDYVFMNATGNHDTDHKESYAHFIQTFHYPYYNTDLGAFYHFIYGNAVFIMLDSDNAGQELATQGVISDEQMEWLEEILEKYALKNYWIFIFMHHQMYSTGDSGIMNIYELAYKDLFDEYHVDAVFFGHDHHFEVFWTGRNEEWGGTHYFLVGNASKDVDIFIRNPNQEERKLNYIWKGRTYIYERDGILDGDKGGVRNDEVIKKAHIYGVIEQGFTHISVNGDECDIKMIGTQNNVYFHDKIKRTGCGKKYHKPIFMKEC